DVAQVLVDRHHLEYAQTQLAGRDHIFTFDPLFAPQASRVLEVPQAPLVDLPGIVAVAMAPLQQPLGRGADLLGLLQLAGRYAQLQFLQRLARPLHRLYPHRLLIGAPLVGIDDDHPHAGDSRGDPLRPGARRIDLLSRRDPYRAIDPLGLVDGSQPLIQLSVPPPLQAHQIAGIPRSDRIEIIPSDHTSLADEDQAVERESLVPVGNGLADGGVVHLVPGPDMMRDRPAGHHHHGDDHLDVVRLAIAAVAVL